MEIFTAFSPFTSNVRKTIDFTTVLCNYLVLFLTVDPFEDSNIIWTEQLHEMRHYHLGREYFTGRRVRQTYVLGILFYQISSGLFPFMRKKREINISQCNGGILYFLDVCINVHFNQIFVLISFSAVCSPAVVELLLLLYLMSVLASVYGNKDIAREGKRTFWGCYMPLKGNLGSLVYGISLNSVFDTRLCISFHNPLWFLNIQRFKGRKLESC